MQVPLVNGTKENWLVRAECRGETFTGPREVSVLSGQTGTYPLHFCPPTMGFFAGSVEFAIAAIGELLTSSWEATSLWDSPCAAHLRYRSIT